MDTDLPLPSDQQAEDSMRIAAQARSVINCLGCGYIFHLLADELTGSQANDSKRMFESGCCVFCNDPISMDDSRSAHQDNQSSIKAKEASEFKDRLLSYDQNSSKRTSVYDDQSDFFLLDSNVWLSEEEKAELRRSHVKPVADEKRPSLITIDLLGRRVLVVRDPSQGSEELDDGNISVSIPLPSSRLQ